MYRIAMAVLLAAFIQNLTPVVAYAHDRSERGSSFRIRLGGRRNGIEYHQSSYSSRSNCDPRDSYRDYRDGYGYRDGYYRRDEPDYDNHNHYVDVDHGRPYNNDGYYRDGGNRYHPDEAPYNPVLRTNKPGTCPAHPFGYCNGNHAR